IAGYSRAYNSPSLARSVSGTTSYAFVSGRTGPAAPCADHGFLLSRRAKIRTTGSKYLAPCVVDGCGRPAYPEPGREVPGTYLTRTRSWPAAAAKLGPGRGK